jgi:predicted dehydrogenase
LLEKPLTHSVETAKALVRHLSGDERKGRALMQAFMRRFDEPLRYARTLLKEGRIGTPFKVVSVLEDPCPPPAGYNSPGILGDMSVHNVDEVIWLLDARPVFASALAANLYNFKVSPVKEAFDDAFVQMRFPGDAVAQVQVSRNHVAGYRNETWVFGDGGVIHVGHFQEDPLRVGVEAYGREGVLEKRVFRMRDYGEKVPMFIERFGPAYTRELAHFVAQCLNDEPFAVTQEDGLNAMLAVEAGVRSLREKALDVPVEYGS